jgi:hypothetical protein
VRSVPLAIAALLATAVACGRDELRFEAGAFHSSANQICTRTFDVRTLRDRPTAARLAREVTRWERGLEQLAALDPSAGEARRFRAMLVHLRRMVRFVRASAKADDESVLPKVLAGVVEGHRASRIARDLRLGACAVVEPVRQPPPDPASPLDAAKALVPPGARVTRTLGCEDESCLLALDVGAIDATRAARAALAAGGWNGIRAGGDVGSRWVMAWRNDLQATFQFPPRDRPPCDTRPDAPFCADTLWVHRVRVPKLFGP